jgi:putative flippase GtrA
MRADTIQEWFPADKRKFILVAAVMTLVNMLVLMGLVKLLGQHPLAANIIRQILTTPLHFGMLRKYVWNDHTHDAVWRQFSRYLGVKAVSVVLKQFVYWVLISWFKVPYMLAYVVCVCMGVGKFNLTKWFVLRNKGTRKPQPD